MFKRTTLTSETFFSVAPRMYRVVSFSKRLDDLPFNPFYKLSQNSGTGAWKVDDDRKIFEALNQGKKLRNFGV